MAASWSHLPSQAASDIKPFKLSVPKSDVDHLNTLLKASVIAPKTFLSSKQGFEYGVTHDWITHAHNYWLNTFSWASAEEKINRHPHFKAEVTDSHGEKFEIHFVGLFSKRADAIPIAFFHGWPGSFLEFLELFDIAKSRWTPDNCPYHFLAPSLPGYTLSSGPSADRFFDVQQVAVLMDQLMTKLGFANGYIAQGGDIGSFVAQGLAHVSDRAKVNMLPNNKPAGVPDAKDDPELSKNDHRALATTEKFGKTGSAYAMEHGMISDKGARIGEKMREWSDPEHHLSLEHIVTNVSLYWLTNTISRCLYPYLGFVDRQSGELPPFIKQPFGYSRFRYEIVNCPQKWAAARGNLVFFRCHEQGGHFAAMERPADLWTDVEEFVTKALPNGLGK